MRKVTLHLLVPLLICIIAFSCRKTDIKNTEPQGNVKFPTTAKELRQVQINKDVANILKYVYQDAKAYYEVNAAIYSEYYDDESVMLRDLLHPETSPLYKTEGFTKFKSPEGVFRKRFFEALLNGDYPVLKEAMGLNKLNKDLTKSVARMEALTAASPADTSIEVYSNSSGTNIYFPYSENHGSNFTASYFDNVNTDPFGEFATIVAADREANSAPGQKPYRYKTYDEYGDIVWEIRYMDVTVDDAFAEINITHIVGAGADVMCHNGCTPPAPQPGPMANRVFLGYIRLNGDQLDKLVSFNKANGGGAEIKLGRISGYLKPVNGQITGFDGDVITPDKKFKRKDISKGRWRKLYGVWEPDWKTDNLEQVLAAWEDDNKGEQTFTGSITTTMKDSAGNGVVGTATYTVKVESEDNLLRQLKMDRYSYFRAAKDDQGCGFTMTDDRGSHVDPDFLPAGHTWPVYECNAAFGWTWPYHVY